MSDAEAIELLARWVNELRGDLAVAETRTIRQRERVAELQAVIDGYAFWIRAGLTPKEIYDAARELDPSVVGAA